MGPLNSLGGLLCASSVSNANATAGSLQEYARMAQDEAMRRLMYAQSSPNQVVCGGDYMAPPPDNPVLLLLT